MNIHQRLLASYPRNAGANFPVRLSVTNTDRIVSQTPAIVMPATVNAGDLLIMVLVCGSSSTFEINNPAGWTQVGTESVFGSIRTRVLYKIADGSEAGGTVTINLTNNSNNVAQVHRIQAGTFNLSGPVEKASATGLGSTMPCPTISPSWGLANTLWIAHVGANGSFSVGAWPYADGRSSIRPGTASATIPSIGSCYRQRTAASESPGSFTAGVGSYSYGTETLAVRPI
ncbi:hypothetical protein D3C76_134650 [compost metagenome]